MKEAESCWALPGRKTLSLGNWPAIRHVIQQVTPTSVLFQGLPLIQLFRYSLILLSQISLLHCREQSVSPESRIKNCKIVSSNPGYIKKISANNKASLLGVRGRQRWWEKQGWCTIKKLPKKESSKLVSSPQLFKCSLETPTLSQERQGKPWSETHLCYGTTNMSSISNGLIIMCCPQIIQLHFSLLKLCPELSSISPV